MVSAVFVVGEGGGVGTGVLIGHRFLSVASCSSFYDAAKGCIVFVLFLNCARSVF